MPNNGTGRATPTRAYQQILGNMFNEQVRVGDATLSLRNPGNNNQLPVSNIDRQLQAHVPTSNLNIQEQIRTSGQPMQNDPPQIGIGSNPSNTNSLQQTSLTMVSVPAI